MKFFKRIKVYFFLKILGLTTPGKRVEIKVSLLSVEKIALRRYFFRKENLDEFRLNNFILDK